MLNKALEPRIIRVGQALFYCGMSDRVFNAEIRPFLTEIRIGVQGVGFDKFELDEVLDDYIQRYGRAPTKNLESEQCKKSERKPVVASMIGRVSGTSTKELAVSEFAKAQERVRRKKPSAT
tara:strand:+ start:3539 stop:3901 length:363 start_codon:yes stop_codon:yes gene_type:complete